ncbi:hypothetical protein I41_15310 [Lacipirellula limnantheis]|uniref:Uncharacterized protein n=1 Tax=Lacipirellula limnantheis TaxID=2528024 RepID=A0A517TVH3_9BACT|nr:hypothetical protein I41_15310 [Lacipirellula limnantheis]
MSLCVGGPPPTASVHQRLFNASKQTQRPFNEVLQHDALGRWLFRRSQSRRREHLVLKGDLMHIVWKTPAERS